MPRFDARAAMAPDGALQGFGDLTAALLMAPRLREKLDAESQQRQDERSYRDSQQQLQRDQLAQALGIHKDQMGLEQQRIGNEKESRQGENVRKWAEDAGTGLKNLYGALTGGNKRAGPAGPQYRPQIYKNVTTQDPNTGAMIHHQVLKSPEENAADRAAWYDAQGIPDPKLAGRPQLPAMTKPTDPIEVIAARRDANKRVQDQQRAQGLMSLPGDVRPPPSTVGLPQEDQAPTAQQDQAPITQLGPKVTPRRFTPEESETVRKMPLHWQQDLQQVLETGNPDAIQKAYARIAIMRQKQQIPVLANRER